MEHILDLHTHSKYSRACSKDLLLPNIAKTCELRGIDIVSTGDFTHPAWFSDISEQLHEVGEGVFGLQDGSSTTKFVLGTEVACIYKDKEKVRRVHLLLFMPTIESVSKLNYVLEVERGKNIRADGRPILGIPAKELLQIILDIDPRSVMIPAHAWTPWFAIFGSKSGYDSIEECFEELTPHIHAIETGLSSDPAMNWRLSALDNITLVSNSDAHSLPKLGREANVFDFVSKDAVSYDEIMRIIAEKDKEKFLYTIEFFPEEGKYHYDGHRDCDFWCEPQQTVELGGKCPKCDRGLTVGVQYQVNKLADREQTEFSTPPNHAIPYKSIIPLREIIAAVMGRGVNTKGVAQAYDQLVESAGTEFGILLHVQKSELLKATTPEIAEGIIRVREGKVYIKPGYDGVFGKISVVAEGETIGKKQDHLL